MREPHLSKTVYAMHQAGLSIRKIARRLKISRHTIRAIIERKGEMPLPAAPQRQIALNEEILRTLYAECHGQAQRVWEILTEEHKLKLSYATLTRRLRRLHISSPLKTRCHRVADTPGLEMQHDTSVYQVRLGECRTKLVASILYLRYSKRRYVKFYRNFNRFRMKCFFHEALTYWEHTAQECVIDNTNLARLRGTGSNALIVPEMESFARRFGFVFRCHALGHPNRKAGEERSFYTLETNFLPGRTFQNLDDLNRQAFEWATVRMYHRPVGKAKLLPARAFEAEVPHLLRVPPELCPPYLELPRLVDQYGFVACDGNYYWVPGDDRQTVRVLLFDRALEIYSGHTKMVAYPLPPDGTKNQSFSPPGQPKVHYEPKHRKHPTDAEERSLRALSPAVSQYLDFALKPKGSERHRLVRTLYTLWRQTSDQLLERIVARAQAYGVTHEKSLEGIAVLLLSDDGLPIPDLSVDERLQERQSYLDGLSTGPADFSGYEDGEEEPGGTQEDHKNG